MQPDAMHKQSIEIMTDLLATFKHSYKAPTFIAESSCKDSLLATKQQIRTGTAGYSR